MVVGVRLVVGRIGVVLLATLVAMLTLVPAPTAAQEFPGGFLESASSTAVRPTLTASQIQAFLPRRGPFTFPAPYNTQGIRLTNSNDCGGKDCVNYVGYSYWRRINNHVGSDTMYIGIGLNGAPTLFSYNKITEQVQNLGPMAVSGNEETAYFSASLPTTYYLQNDTQLLRYDILSKQTAVVFDIRSAAATAVVGSNRIIWQLHSSNDDRVHSATVKNSSYNDLGCVAYREDTQKFFYYPKKGDYDECQIDKSGQWLLIKENVDGRNGEDNRIIDLQTGVETLLLDQDGAAGHSDNGYGYMVAADNWNNLPNAMRFWKFGQSPPGPGTLVYHNMDWSVEAPAHVSHANATPGTTPDQQYLCGSSANRINSSRANEVICFRLDTSLEVLVVAPVLTNLDAPGGGDDYSKAPKGNLDVTGRYFIWTSNLASNRLDAFLVKVPAQLLLSTQPDTTPPSVAITSPTNGATVSGTVNVTLTGTDDVGVTMCRVDLDGSPIATLYPPTTSVPWASTAVSNGLHTLTATAYDAAGNTAHAAISVTVNNAYDTTPPTVQITSPTARTKIGSSVNISAQAADDVGVQNVKVYGDGVLISKVPCSGAPSCQGSVTWSTGSLSPGTHKIKAVATDTSSHTRSITITVSK